MAENVFDAFDSEEGEITVAPMPSTGSNPFDQWDNEPAAPAPSLVSPEKPAEQPFSFQPTPGIHFQDDPEINGLLSELSDRNKQDSKAALDKARGDGFLDGISDPRQYLEAAKGIVPGGIRFAGTTAKGAAAIQSAPSLGYDKMLRAKLETFDRIDAGDRVRDMRDTVGTFYQNSSPADRAVQRAELERQIAEFNPTPVQDRALFKAGESVTEFSKGVLPAAPGYEDAVGRQLGEGLGSLVAGLPMGFLGRVPAAVFFGAGGSGEAVDRALEFDRQQRAAGHAGLTQEQIVTSALWGVAPGTTDLLPVEVLLGRLKIPAPFTKTFAKVIGRIGGQAFVEGFQESGQAFLQNLIAEEMYNPEQSLTEGLVPEGGLGAGVGAIAQVGKEVITSFGGRRAGRGAQPTATPAPVEPGTPDGIADVLEAVEAIDRARPQQQPAEVASVESQAAAPIVEDAQEAAEAVVEEIAPETTEAEILPPEDTVEASEADYETALREAARQSFDDYLALEEQLASIPEDQAPPADLRNDLMDAEDALIDNFRIAGLPGDSIEAGPQPVNSIDDIKRAFERATPEEIASYWLSRPSAQTVDAEAVRSAPALPAASSAASTSPGSRLAPMATPQTPEAKRDLDLFRAAWADSIEDLTFAVTGQRRSQLGALDEAPVFERRRGQFTGEPRTIVDRLESNIQSVVAAYQAGNKPDALKALNAAVADAQALRAAVADDEKLRPIANLLTQDVLGAARKHIFDFGKPSAATASVEADAAPSAPANIRQSFAALLDSKAPLSKAAEALGVSEEDLAPLVEEAVQKGWLRRDAAGKVRRAPKTARTGNIAALAVADVAPDGVPGEGNVVKTDAAEARTDAIKAAIHRAAAKILPADVSIDVVDNIAIARLRREDEMLALREQTAFARWFGDSKVVDENGEPLVVYHGTIADFEAFDIEKTGVGRSQDTGFYFTPDAKRASRFAYGDGGQVIPVYLKIENPYIVDEPAKFFNQLDRDIGQYASREKFIEYFESRGFDGLRLNFEGKLSSLVAFHPEQIKSAIGNRGTFDPADPRISYALRPRRGQTESEKSAMLGAEQAEGAMLYPVAPRDEWYGDANFESTGGRLIEMTPDEFLAQARPMEIEETARDNIDDLKNHILSGRTLDPLALYANGKEDGRHRAHAAKELGIAKVPVLQFRKADEISSPGKSSGGSLSLEDREGVSDDRSAEDRAAIGGEGVEAGEGQPGAGIPVGAGEGMPAAGVEGRDARILRIESGTFRPDGSIIAGRLSGTPGRDVSGASDAGPVQQVGDTQEFSIGGFSGRVTGEEVLSERQLLDAGIPLHRLRLAKLTYRVYADNADVPVGKRIAFKKIAAPLLAQAKITQHMDGTWEVSMVEVNPTNKRKGLASQLYAAIEADLGIRMSPSGVLTEDGYKFWLRRSPASVQWHEWSPVDQTYISPNWIDTRIDDLKDEVTKIQRKAIITPLDDIDLRSARSELQRLIGLWKELPEEARAAKDQMFALRAYHGSPHDFDRFDLSRIGTGEGAQAFGRGLYFAEKPDVAKSYLAIAKDRVPPYNDIVAREFPEISALSDGIAEKLFMKSIHTTGTPREAAALVQSNTPELAQIPRDRLASAIKRLRNAREGRLYEVEIDVEPYQLLDWDKPIKEQSPEVKAALAKIPWAEAYLDTSFNGSQIAPHTDEGMRQLREAGIPGIRFLDQGSRGAGEGSRNIVIFDDSLVRITHKDGTPVSAAERAEVVDQMFALRGFYSPAIRAAESISQAKGTGEQFWKQITKVPGVRKDELDWMGLEEFLKDKPSITKAEVLEFMRAHQVELDEKVLGGGSEIEKTLSEISANDAPDYLAKAERVWSYKVGGFQYFIGHFPESSRPYRLTDFEGSSLGDVASVDAARHIADGDANAENAGGTKFGDYKVPGGENYRELLIRLPELGEPQGAASAELNKRLDDLRAQRRAIENGDVPATREQERAVGEEITRTIKELAPKYTSKHFADQEIVHLRVDDRTGPNGEKVLFVNEVQSDLHQAGRQRGYKGSPEEAKAKLALDEITEATKSDFQAWARANDAAQLADHSSPSWRPLQEKAKQARESLTEKRNGMARERGFRSMHDLEMEVDAGRVVNAPFKGDLWLELALKRALLYASENGYDAISWARSDQIAKAVGAEPEKLALQYDQKIGKFLDKYTRKWGGKVEEESGLVPADDADTSVSTLQSRAQSLRARLDEARASGNSVEVETIRERLSEVETRLAEIAAPSVNPLLRITPQMRASVLEGQPLAMRRQSQQASEPQALGRTDPYNMQISIAMRAIEAEAAAKGKAPVEEAIRVLRHEAVEFFKAMGLFQPKEWQLLERTARQKGWIETTGVRDSYSELYARGMSEAELNQILIKEAIAEQYSEFHLGRKQFSPAITKIFQRLKTYLTRIMNWMKGQGFQTWEDVFTRIDEGEFKARFERAFGGVAQARQGGVAPMAVPGSAVNLPLSPAPPVATRGTTPSAPGSLIDIQRELRRRLGLTVAKGRLDPATARAVAAAGGKLMGQFDRQTEVIRLRVLQDIDTEAHEVAHALENRYPLAALQSIHATELTAVASLTGQTGLSEGFAEFFRLYMTNPQAAQAHAPVFYREFEDFLDVEDAQTLTDIQDIRDQYAQWRNASSAGRITAAVKSGVPTSTWQDIRKEHSQGGMASVGGMFWRYLEKVYKARIDRTNPIRKLVMQIARQAEANNQDLDLTAWKNPQMQAQKINSFDAAGYLDIVRGVHWENAAGHGSVNLRDALATAFGGTAYELWTDAQRDAFGAYLIARRGRWLWQRFDMDPTRNRGRLANAPQNPQSGDWYYDTMQRRRRVFLGNRWEDELTHAPDKHTRADHDMTVAELQQANPQFAPAANMVYAFLRDLALKRYQAGLDTRDEYNHKIASPDYVPWFRDMTDQLFAGTALSGRKVAAKFKLKGSYRDFINPIEGIARQVFDTNFEIAVNKPKLLLAKMAEAVQGAGRYAEVIPATRMRVEEVRIRDALENAGREQGLPPQDVKQMVSAVAAMIGDDAVGKLFKSDKATEGTDAILHYMDGGELKMLQIHDDGHGIARDIIGFFEVVRGTPIADGLTNMLVGLVRIPQKGITTTLAFFYRNILRDMQQATVLQAGYFPLVSNIRTIASNKARRARGDETWAEILARHGGIMGGIGRTDVAAMRQGRVSELRTLGVTLEPWRRDFWARTMNPWHDDFWKWAEWSESNSRQTLARIAFNRTFADAKNRYPTMPVEQQTFVALEAAVQRSRDYTDYGRVGDAPSQGMINKLIMFLNPAIQGPDKAIRTLFLAQANEGKFAAAQVVRKKLLPLISSQYQNRPLTESETAALKDSARAWLTVLMIAFAHLAIEMAFNDPDELEDRSELERAMYVTFTINGETYKIPRGFDAINLVSNGVRANYESWFREDPTAKERFRRSLLLLTPPMSSPLLDLYIGWKHNRNNFFNTDVEPEYMQGLMPTERYSAYTSNLAREISEGISPIIDVSPIMVEYSMNAIGSDWSRDILRAYDAFDPDKPALKWQEFPFLRAARGSKVSRGSNEYWELMGSDGDFQQPAGSYKQEAVDRRNWRQEDIRRFFEERVTDDDAKAFAILNAHYEKDQRRLHPMERARDMVSAASATMREIADNRIDVPVTRKKVERAEVSRAVRGYAMEILAEVNRREYRNALIALQRPGYENREPQPVEPYLDELKTISPEIWASLRKKMVDSDGRPRVYNYDEVRKFWPEMKRRLLSRDKREEIIEKEGQVEFKDFRGDVGIARSNGIR